MASYSKIAGISHYQRAARKLCSDQVLDAVREPENLHDENAIALFLYGDKVGYLPSATAQYLAPKIDKGVEFCFKVESCGIASGTRFIGAIVSWQRSRKVKMSGLFFWR